MTLAKSRWTIHRLAHLCALLAVLVYQPLAALHFAIDEAHHSNPATSIQVAHGGHAHTDNGPHGHSHGDHLDQLCDFCILAGVSLPPLAAAAAIGAPTYALVAHPFAGSVRAEKRLRPGHPVRAPPRSG